MSLNAENSFELFPSKFSKEQAPIPINGLVWMGSKEFMNEQINEKLSEGFQCIKMKIGAIDFQTEIALIESIRKEYPKEKIEIRVDANGAFLPEEAMEKLKILSDLDIHSIEQPIKQGQTKQMRELCENTPLPIALDEELISVFEEDKKEELLRNIKPQYIILKPSLLGGFAASLEWIKLADEMNIGWWVTSALESNIGLNAIAQWTYTLKNDLPQGLGTGSLYTNNLDSPLTVAKGTLYYDQNKRWQNKLITELCI